MEMSPAERTRGLASIPQFDIFRAIIVENIGYLPEITVEGGAYGHRVRIFRGPPAIEVRYSEQSLARYIELSDVVTRAAGHASAPYLASCLFCTQGAELLRGNRLVGLAFIAHGFQTVLYRKLPYGEIIDTAISQASLAVEPNVFALINLFLPLAHEIGHVPEAQALCPAVVMGPAIHDTYRLNYDEVARFTGNFAYEDSLDNVTSPLHLNTLREEIAGDYFAVCTIFWLVSRVLKEGDVFPIYIVAMALFMFPLVMALDSVCLSAGKTDRAIQDTVLALHCRYSVIADAILMCVKHFFRGSKVQAEGKNQLQEALNRMSEIYGLTWNGIKQNQNEVLPLLNLDSEDAIFAYFAEATLDSKQLLAISAYLDLIMHEVEPYSLSAHNSKEFMKLSHWIRQVASRL
ncbi:MAG: hypothetical protein ABI380_11225 [Edaphobacter sp.]